MRIMDMRDARYGPGERDSWQLKRRDARVQDGGAPVVHSSKATVDRRIKLDRAGDFLAVAAESRCNIGKAPALTLPAGRKPRLE
ncbi:hypothetical protein [Bradyrhizobium sp. CB1015]|uniref:hypothetical protein n=1 Tax=Bradyrhizobium sp. CB1015 TaxID=2976822 RepID=UPI0021A9A9C3|nr:hypothetical protein [Bradyrhizobium sp. CB1015]UWU89331.1 hypothetical protein N2604_22775 [Bradyrhizobium sp. CB1015]